MDVWVGSYTSASGGNGVGISTFRRSPDGSLTPDRSLEMTSPSWLTAHPTAPVVYATNETTDGAITTVSSELEILDTTPTGGADPCHLALSADNRFLLCSNYSSGNLSVFSLDGDGRITERTDFVQHEGSGPHAERQEAAHVHMSTVRDDVVSVVDLGTDEITSYTLGDNGKLTQLSVSAMPPGTGPRQLVRRDGSDLAYVVGEVNGTLVVVREGPVGTFTPVTAVPATAKPWTGDRPNWVAHLEIRGDRLYLSNRNPDCVTEFDISGEVPVALGDHPCGAFPRHFEIVDDVIYVAAQRDDAIVAFPVGGTAVRYETGTPTFVLVR
ncbi:lactonase family protein [Actinophytocola oryzae]|uniref:6-phosphogluconolactonase (Cycloisomerase 2 family) n=1 Tax=Actinophytocola oryzae TaxID=502181 RepID=A0A4R7UU82_9PSEU|nr:beta-propeller fold lactonase family protein [Actinophytocola oryzae]TDV38627.1 6-phosphogluconolactonase (cycloisomerase 2 family) [Actinophytocola oryzae]